MTDVSTQNRWTQRPTGSTWGDFGAHDQRGRMNLITDERRLAANREVKDGMIFVLGGRRRPVVHWRGD
ncbi:MAG: hypothetical protein ABIM50_07050 [Novosphingobium sp.]